MRVLLLAGYALAIRTKTQGKLIHEKRSASEYFDLLFATQGEWEEQGHIFSFTKCKSENKFRIKRRYKRTGVSSQNKLINQTQPLL